MSNLDAAVHEWVTQTDPSVQRKIANAFIGDFLEEKPMSRFNPNRPVQTREGLPARIICTDRKGRYPIVALVYQADGCLAGEEVTLYYRKSGKFATSEKESRFDLVNVPLTSEEYVAKKGAVCPVCGTDDITGGDIDFAEGSIEQQIRCDRCGAEWQDDYDLTGYCNLETGEEESE